MGCSLDYFPGEPAPVEYAERTLADSEAEAARRTLDRLKARHPAEWSEWQRVLPLLAPVYDFGADEPFGFAQFLVEVGRRPSPSHFVRRRDKSKAYEQGNMAWAERQSRKPKVDSPYLTVEEAATYCRVSKQTLYNHHYLGNVHSMPGHGRLLFRREELDQWLSTRRRTPARGRN